MCAPPALRQWPPASLATVYETKRAVRVGYGKNKERGGRSYQGIDMSPSTAGRDIVPWQNEIKRSFGLRLLATSAAVSGDAARRISLLSSAHS